MGKNTLYVVYIQKISSRTSYINFFFIFILYVIMILVFICKIVFDVLNILWCYKCILFTHVLDIFHSKGKNWVLFSIALTLKLKFSLFFTIFVYCFYLQIVHPIRLLFLLLIYVSNH